MVVQNITDLVADSTTDFFYNWSSKIKSNLVLVFFLFFSCIQVFFRESHSLLESLVVPIPFTTITLGILRTEFPENGNKVN
jgi:hypothetical protein